MSDISSLLLDLLVCPLTKGALRYAEQEQELVSEKAGISYPIRSGVPIMIVEEARIVDAEKAKRFTYFSS